MPDDIVRFFSGGEDSEGRTLDEILAWDDDRLEHVHDYVQWIFPTRRPSSVNPDAPCVTDDTIRAFGADPRAQDGLVRAFARMLRFYGLREHADRVEIDDERFAARSLVWLSPGNHNHLRLTRIMDSLSTLGLRARAAALQRCLIEDVCAGPGRGRVLPATIRFWSSAISR